MKTKEEVCELLKRFENDNSVFDELEELGPDVFFIALEEGMIEVAIKLITPVEVNYSGEKRVRIMFDPFSSINNEIYETIEKKMDESTKKRLLAEIYNIDFNKFFRMKIKDTHARQISGNSFYIGGINDIIHYFEPACIMAGVKLFELDVCTWSNDTSGVIEDGDFNDYKCAIGIVYNSLSDENKKYLAELEKRGFAKKNFNDNNYNIIVPCYPDDTVLDVSNRLLELVKGFKKNIFPKLGKNLDEITEKYSYLMKAFSSKRRKFFPDGVITVERISEFAKYFGDELIYLEDKKLFFDKGSYLRMLDEPKRRKTVKIESIVNMAFRDITAKGYFDIEKGNYPIPKVWNLAMKDIPLQMTNYVNECGYGCCFVFSAYMIDILNKYGIKAYMIGSSEGNGIRASVLYEKDGQYYVANPVEDIEYFTEHNISLKDREKYYIGDSTTMVKSKDNIHNAACYTLEEFSKKYGSIWYIGSMNKDDNSTLEEEFALMKKRCIAPPDKANYKI